METIHSTWTIGPRVVDRVHECRRIRRRTQFVSKVLTFHTCQRLLYQQCLQQVIAESEGMVQWLQAAPQPKLVHCSVSSVRLLAVGIDSTSRSQGNRTRHISISSSSSRPYITLLISACRAVQERWAWRQALPRSLRIHSISPCTSLSSRGIRRTSRSSRGIRRTSRSP